MPHLESLHVEYKDQGVNVLVVDASNRRDETQEIITENAISIPVLLDGDDVAGESYGVFATPTTFIVDGDGLIIFKHLGYTEGMESMLEKEVSLLLTRL